MFLVRTELTWDVEFVSPHILTKNQAGSLKYRLGILNFRVVVHQLII